MSLLNQFFCRLTQTHIISRVEADRRRIKGFAGGAQLGVSRERFAKVFSERVRKKGKQESHS